jgi:hypothetical protein
VPIILDSVPTPFTLTRFPSGTTYDIDQWNTLVALESISNRFCSSKARPADMTISFETCEDIYDCIGLSIEGTCGTSVVSRIQTQVKQEYKYTISVRLLLGECYAFKDVSQAIWSNKSKVTRMVAPQFCVRWKRYGRFLAVCGH